MIENRKPIIGITCGDLNGIGIELIIKSLSDVRILDHCTPVVFASNKSINFYRKAFPNLNFVYQSLKDVNRANPKMINVVNCWEEEVNITPGILNEIGGNYARLSLLAATDALIKKEIDGLVTAPIHKKNIVIETFAYTGHTPFLKNAFGVKDVLMLMVATNMRVGLVTEHLPISGVATHITKEAVLSKIDILQKTLPRDFGVDKPKIAVLGLNPHAGDSGLIGNEEETILKPAIKEAKEKYGLVFGPYSADAFFARGQYQNFDGVLAMYHDQGLIPFKSLAIGEGINYTAGLQGIRTSPDHGTAFDIAGKNLADSSSFSAAIFECVDIIKRRFFYDDNRANPIKKSTQRVIDAVTEKAVILPD